MQTFFSWLTSQSGVSLLVALIALTGVLATTWWNNKATDKRRRDDQVAEDTRRRADDERRERERKEALQRDDWARQRLAVAKCLREIMSTAQQVKEKVATRIIDPTPGSPLSEHNYERGKIVKAIELSRFYDTAVANLELLDIEITQPDVSKQIHMLLEQMRSDDNKLKAAYSDGGQAWIDKAEKTPPLSKEATHEIQQLIMAARLALLEHPDHMSKKSIQQQESNDSNDQ